MCYFVNRWVCSQESAISHFGVLAQRRCRLHISQRRWKNTLIDSTWSLFVSLIYFILFLPVSLPSGPDPRRSAHPRLLSLRVPPLSFWFCPSSPAQDLDPDQHGRVPSGWGLCQLPSAQLCQRASLQVSEHEVPPFCERDVFQPQQKRSVMSKQQTDTCQTAWSVKNVISNKSSSAEL